MAVLGKEMTEKLRAKAKGSLYFFAKGVLQFDWLDRAVHRPLCLILELYDGYKDLCTPWSDYVEVLTPLLQERALRHQERELTEDELAKVLEKIKTKGIKRVKVTLPRGWLKTTLCSCAYPLWRGVRNVNMRFLLTQNTYTNACSKLKRISGAVKKNPVFKALFPEILPDSTCTWKSDSLCLKRTRDFDESTFEAAGTRTQATSRHYDVICEDDTVAPELEDLNAEAIAPSEDDIGKAIGWHKLATPLLNSPGDSQRLVVGTRWAEVDLLSYVDEKEPDYVSYELAVVDGDKVPRYQSRFPQEVLDGIEATLGPYMYSCLYMNAPMCGSDMTFKPSWITYYETEPRDLMVYTTVDVAGDPGTIKKAKPDYNVVITTGKHLYGDGIYILDYWRERANPGEVIDEVFRQVKLYHSVKAGVESVAYQNTLAYWLREKMKAEDFYFLVEGITHGRQSKEARIRGLQPIMANRQLMIRPWMKELVSELLAFPLGAFDDIIDALSFQLGFWQLTKSRAQVEMDRQAKDPLSLISALNELNDRYKKPMGFPHDLMVA